MGARLDREIEEILAKYDSSDERRPLRLRTGRVARVKRRLAALRPSFPAVPAFQPSQLMLVGAIAVLFGYFFAAFLPDALQRWIIIVGAIVAIAGLALALIAKRGPRTIEKRWRGQVIRYEAHGRGRRGWFGKRR